MRTEVRRLKDIIPYENNPRNNDDAVDAVAESIRQCTYVAPIIVDEDYVILAGHTRYKALKKLKYKEVEVVVKEGLTEEQKRKYRILDNKTNELADWNADALAEELIGLDFDGFDFGFDSDLSSGGSSDSSRGAGQQQANYTDKADAPQYTPSGDDVELSACLDRSKADQLLAEIDSASVTDDEKEFLRAAAMRHLCFSYKRVADYYANASKEMQELMERSALVIIDYDDAIKHGYAELRVAVKKLLEVDHGES